ncbi:transmembrane protein 8A-like isoform X2 [Acanthaster planci]|uniref:Transmembrane protein 8A-like isoform X2 n=1 Tax=Acanthaster planci TaxID=133434 RepID=A0A8B7Y1X8_ACAPL|nr:transmembrane protein 8A-like isoform X2 [Acanthaster planci]
MSRAHCRLAARSVYTRKQRRYTCELSILVTMSTQSLLSSLIRATILLPLFYVINGQPGYGEQLFGTFRLKAYGSFGDVTLFHVVMPPHCTTANWDISVLKDTLECPKTSVHLALQPGSLPVTNPYNTSFPPHINTQSQRNLNLFTMSSAQPVRITFWTPTAGDWYLVAFLPRGDNNKIEQQGLGGHTCRYFIQMGVAYWQAEDIKSLSTQTRTTVELATETNYTTAMYRFYVSPLTKYLTFSYQNCQVGSEFNQTEVSDPCPVALRVGPGALPSVRTPPVLCKSNTSCSVQFGEPLADTWYYVRLDLSSLDEPTSANLSLGVETQKCMEENIQVFPVSSEDMELRTLVLNSNASLIYSPVNPSDNGSAFLHPALEEKESEPESYPPASFTRGLYLSPLSPHPPPVLSNWCPPVLPLSSAQLGGASPFKKFIWNTPNATDGLPVSPDTPVVVKFELDLPQDIGGNLVIKADVANKKDLPGQAFVTLCLRQGGIPPLNGTNISCDPEDSLTFNSHSADAAFPWIVPFPAPGVWYLSLESWCKSGAGVVPCNDTAYVLLDIGLYGCIDNCGEYGSCHSAIDMGILYYYCKCSRGYQGWGCTDDSEAWSQAYFLTRVLLLTLSNLFFIFPFILALVRRHFVPAISFFCTLFFSSFYHSCDADSLCIMSYNTLQFCDFFSAFMSFFLTLIAMARLPVPLRHSLEILGAFGLALGTTYNRFSLWAAAVPVGVGMGVLLISWARRWYKRRRCYPTTKWRWLLFILPGTAIIITGLCLYAFLETSDNYQYVHSAWHVAMAIGVLFLLPPRERVKEESTESIVPAEDSAAYIREIDMDFQ